MEKLKLGKHEHSLTDLLKVLIFSIVMLAPFFAIGIQCGYVMFNKNAKDSYSGTTTYDIQYKYQSNEVNSADDLVVGNIYKLNCNNKSLLNLLNNDDGYLDFYLLTDLNLESMIYIDDILDGIPKFSPNYIYTTSCTNNNGYINVYYSYEQYNDIDYSNSYKYNGLFTNDCIIQLIAFDIDYTYLSYTDYNEIESVNIDNSGTLDNVFYYAIDQLGNQPIFNWTENTAIYNAIDGMTTGLELGTGSNTLALLLTYWSLNTAIYIVFDIIIVCFTKITHFFAKE